MVELAGIEPIVNVDFFGILTLSLSKNIQFTTLPLPPSLQGMRGERCMLRAVKVAVPLGSFDAVGDNPRICT